MREHACNARLCGDFGNLRTHLRSKSASAMPRPPDKPCKQRESGRGQAWHWNNTTTKRARYMRRALYIKKAGRQRGPYQGRAKVTRWGHGGEGVAVWGGWGGASREGGRRLRGVGTSEAQGRIGTAWANGVWVGGVSAQGQMAGSASPCAWMQGVYGGQATKPLAHTHAQRPIPPTRRRRCSCSPRCALRLCRCACRRGTAACTASPPAP